MNQSRMEINSPLFNHSNALLTSTPTPPSHLYSQSDDEYTNEPPLLDELEIYPIRIIEKSLAILNPFHAGELTNNPHYLFDETDLAGPIIFCMTLATTLFLSGGKSNFGYIYGLSIISVLGMFALITLMCNSREHFITLTGVASILGYSILPIVSLSVFGMFFSLHTSFGLLMTTGAIGLATYGASRIFCIMTRNPEQLFLFAYPCALLYITFVLLVLF